jgi:molecular chaperone GrpE
MSDTENNNEDAKSREEEMIAAAEAENLEAVEAGNLGDDGMEDLASEQEQTIARLNGEVDDLRNRFMRAVADAQNARKRGEKEVKDAREYAVTSFAMDMVEVADTLTKAVDMLDDETIEAASDTMKNMATGVAMTERVLQTKLERHNVKKIDPQPGDNFDPHVHQAVAHIPSEHPSGKIAAVMQTGYAIGGRTLRAAMIAVSSGAAASDKPADDSTPGDNVDVKA